MPVWLSEVHAGVAAHGRTATPIRPAAARERPPTAASKTQQGRRARQFKLGIFKGGLSAWGALAPLPAPLSRGAKGCALVPAHAWRWRRPPKLAQSRPAAAASSRSDGRRELGDSAGLRLQPERGARGDAPAPAGGLPWLQASQVRDRWMPALPPADLAPSHPSPAAPEPLWRPPSRAAAPCGWSGTPADRSVLAGHCSGPLRRNPTTHPTACARPLCFVPPLAGCPSACRTR